MANKSKAVEVHVGRDYVALVDSEDYKLVSQYTWSPMGNQTYKNACTQNMPRLMMHRLIMDVWDRAEQVVHLDGNHMNNQKANLKVTDRKGVMGTRVLNINSRNPWKGVRVLKNYGNGKIVYSANIRNKNGKKTYIGRFDTPEEACYAYDAAAVEIWGELAMTNAKLGTIKEKK